MGAAVVPIIASVAGSVLSSALAPSKPSAPAAIQQAIPQAAPEPEAPEPVVSKAEDLGEEPVVDTEAARVRAAKRRKSAEDRRLFALGEDNDETVILTKSLLGE